MRLWWSKKSRLKKTRARKKSPRRIRNRPKRRLKRKSRKPRRKLRKQKRSLWKSRKRNAAGSDGRKANNPKPVARVSKQIRNSKHHCWTRVRSFYIWIYSNSTIFQLILRLLISSQATLLGEPRFGRVTQPGLRNKTPLRFSLRGTWV